MSERKRSNPRIFIGWWSILFIGVISGLGHGFNSYGISVFFKDIATELELNRAFTAMAAGIGRLEGGVTAPLTGWLSDKFGPRWIVIIGIAITASGLIFMNFISEVWQYYLAWGGLIGFGLNIGLTVAVDKSINDWFMRRRGLAQGIKFALISVFGIVVLQVITPLVLTQGWRFTCLLWGIIMFASLPLAYWLVKPQRPEYYGLLPDGAGVNPVIQKDRDTVNERAAGNLSGLAETEYTFQQAMKTSTFWLLIIGFTVHNILAAGLNVHFIPFLTDFGIAPAVASGMMGMMVFFTIPSRFFGGIITDRLPKSRLHFLLIVAFLLQVIGIGSYLTFRNLPAVYVLLACHGLSAGAVTPIILLILGRYFGRKAFGSILGAMLAFIAPLGMISPVYYGWVFDTTGSYDLAFITAIVLASGAVITTFFVHAPRTTGDGVLRATW